MTVLLTLYPPPLPLQSSWCSFSMMVKWANDGLLQANDGKMLVNDVEMLVNDGELSVWSFTHFTIISLKYTIIRSFDHHWEAAPTAKNHQFASIHHTQRKDLKKWNFFFLSNYPAHLFNVVLFSVIDFTIFMLSNMAIFNWFDTADFI